MGKGPWDRGVTESLEYAQPLEQTRNVQNMCSAAPLLCWGLGSSSALSRHSSLCRAGPE